MKKEELIEKIILSLKSKGSDINYLKWLRDKSLESIHKDIDLKDVLHEIEKDIEYETKLFLDDKNKYDTNYISGISTGIYLPDIESGSYKFKILGGTCKRNDNEMIDIDTKFDLASITKLYTLILLFKFEEYKFIDLNSKVKDINPDFQCLEDYTINDLVRLHGVLKTNGNVACAWNTKQAHRILRTVHLVDSSRKKNTYTDFGALIIGDTIEKIISRELGKNYKLDEVMDLFLFKPLGIKETTYLPGPINVAGNNNYLGLPHDPKSTALGGITGHAGLFSNSEGLIKLSDGLYNKNYLSDYNIKRLGEVTFDGSPKGNLGVYVKHPLGWDYTYTAPEYSTGSFTHQGYTGGIASFDPNNKIHNNILVSAIYEGDEEIVHNGKPIGYSNRFREYQIKLTKEIMLMYILKTYYNKYIGIKEDISNTVKLSRNR